MLIDPSNASRKKPTGVAPNGTSQWQGGDSLPYLPHFAAATSQAQYFMTFYPLEFLLINGATAATAGNTDPYYEFNVLGRNLHAIQVSSVGTYNATVLIEGTLDGTHWETIQSATSTGIFQLTGLYQSIRVSIPTYTSGTITVTAMTQRT